MIQSLNTTEIRKGDVVRVHGMRVLIDVDPIISEPWGGTENGFVYAWVGLVLNPEDRPIGLPRDWLYRDRMGQPRTEPRWNVQGNKLSRWSVERSDGPTVCGGRCSDAHEMCDECWNGTDG